MSQITSGSITIEDGVKKDQDYAPPRKASVTLAFSVAEDEDHVAIFEKASDAATTKLAELLGTAAKVKPTVVGTPLGDSAKAAYAAGAAAPAPEKAKPGRPPKAKVPPADDIMADVSQTVETKPEVHDDGLGDILGGPAPADPITDEKLVDEIRKKNAEINDGPAIRKLIGTFVVPPGKSIDMTQADRPKFLAALAGLKATV